MKNVFSIAVIIVALVLIFSCGEDPEIEINDNNYSFLHLSYENLFYTYPQVYYQIYEPFTYTEDSNHVILTNLNGKLYYNPVSMSQKGINMFDRYYKMSDSLYLVVAQCHRDALKDLMNEDGLFAYHINWHHRLDLLLWDPWYSGMAQGQALSLLSRLGFYANDSISQRMAHEVFSTLNFNLELSEEVTYMNEDGYPWIEEYPADIPDHTFNGFMFAIIGIYDYYHLLSTTEETRKVLSAYLTTIHDKMDLFRNPGTISYYCLRHHHSDTLYHKIHIQQLEYFTKITQDSSFATFADTLRMDYWNY